MLDRYASVIAEHPANPSFASRLRRVRADRNLSQQSLARLAGVHPTTITLYEAGRRKPSFANALALAKALGVSAEFLLDLKGGTTAFQGEERLSLEDRATVQGLST